MLDEKEQKILEKIMKRNNIVPTNNVSFEKFEIRYFQQENFMICVVILDGDVITSGVAKRNPIDKFIPEIGMNKSFSNALKNLF